MTRNLVDNRDSVLTEMARIERKVRKYEEASRWNDGRPRGPLYR